MYRSSLTQIEGLDAGLGARSALEPAKEGLGQERRAASSTFLGMHVRTSGRSYRLDARPEDVQRMNDGDVARYAEESLGMRRGALADHAVDRDEKGVVIRPWAVWG